MLTEILTEIQTTLNRRQKLSEGKAKELHFPTVKVLVINQPVSCIHFVKSSQGDDHPNEMKNWTYH